MSPNPLLLAGPNYREEVNLSGHEVPYHPLWEKGYVSIGDVHTTRPVSAEVSEEQTRFFGLKRECGLHFDDEQGVAA